MTGEELVVKQDAQLMESVLLQGDLSKLSPAQRVNYYQKVCESIGLNPLTRPFDYITLNGKLTLYAKKDAADQLRNIHAVSIDDVDIQETDTLYIVKVKGHNRDGRTDVEIGVVNKKDMQGNLANVQMKAVTKGKRRLTLSLCGLGWLDETEIESIPSARPVIINNETGEIVDALPEPSADPVDVAFPPSKTTMSLEMALDIKNSDGIAYGELPTDKLSHMANTLIKAKKDEQSKMKLDAIKVILDSRTEA